MESADKVTRIMKIMREDFFDDEDDYTDQCREVAQRIVAEDQPKWTAIKEQKPDDEVLVLVCQNRTNNIQAAYHEDGSWWVEWFDLLPFKPTHWMHLPPTPEQAKERKVYADRAHDTAKNNKGRSR